MNNFCEVPLLISSVTKLFCLRIDVYNEVLFYSRSVSGIGELSVGFYYKLTNYVFTSVIIDTSDFCSSLLLENDRLHYSMSDTNNSLSY